MYASGLAGAPPGGIAGKKTNPWSGGNAPGGINTVSTVTKKPVAPKIPTSGFAPGGITPIIPPPKPPVETAVPIHVQPPVLLPGLPTITPIIPPPTVPTEKETVVVLRPGKPSTGNSGGGGGNPVLLSEPAAAVSSFFDSIPQPVLIGGVALALWFLTRKR